MNRAMSAAALAIIITAGAVGCVTLPTYTPPAAPTFSAPTYTAPPAPTPAPPAPAQPAPAPAPAPAPVTPPQSADEAFLDAIAGGFVVYDLPRQPFPEAVELRAATLEAAASICPVLGYDGGRQLAISTATSLLSDPSVFTPAMPTMFVDAAAVHICR